MALDTGPATAHSDVKKCLPFQNKSDIIRIQIKEGALANVASVRENECTLSSTAASKAAGLLHISKQKTTK